MIVEFNGEGGEYAQVTKLEDCDYLKTELNNCFGIETFPVETVQVKKAIQGYRVYFKKSPNPNINQKSLQKIVNCVVLNKPQPSLLSVYTETKNRDYFGRFEALYLKHIYERVQDSCPIAIDVAVEYMCTTSREFGHNRFRSKISRQLKHVKLKPKQEVAILNTILSRFKEGDIDEQFIEQLRFARWLNKDETINLANSLLDSEKDYIARYAVKVLNMGESKVAKSI